MKFEDIILNISKFGASSEEIFNNTLGVNADMINENIIISPGWEPERLFLKNDIKEIVQKSPLFGFSIFNIQKLNLTYIKTGFGAPMVMDAILLLGLSKCRKILFVSSVGALSEKMNIGDILIPEYSASGDGAGRYLSEDLRDYIFAEKQYPDKALFEYIADHAQKICKSNSVNYHFGKTFCVDTIIAQFQHLKDIVNMGYNSIDMESAVAFKTASFVGIPIAALLQVSDNSVSNRSLMSERDQKEERSYRLFVRKNILSEIIEIFFAGEKDES